MSDLTPEVKAAIEAAKNKILDTPRDLRELIENEKKKELETPPVDTDKKEDQPVDKVEKKEKKALTKEELSSVTDMLGDHLGFRKDKKAEADKKEKKDKDDAEAAAKTAKEEADKKAAEEKAKAEEAEKKKVTVRKKTEIDPTELATNVARNVAREVANELRPKVVEPKEEKLGIDLSDDEKSELEVFREMAKANPSYKELPEKYVNSIKKIDGYKTKWEIDNPDKEFDPNDQEHDAFYAKVTPQFNERDFRQAEIRRASSDMLKKQEEKAEVEQASLKAELATKELEPVINETKIRAAGKVLETINPEYLKMVGEKDGFQKFQDEDPIAAQALMISAQRMGSFIEAAHQIDEPKARIKFDQNNPSHVQYVKYLIEKEDEMKSRPMKDQIDDHGRRFVTRQEAIKIPQSERNKVWFLRDTDLISIRVAEEAELAKDFVKKENERLEKLAKLRGWKIDSASPATQNKEAEASKKAAEEVEKKAAEAKKLESPSAGSGGKVDVTDDGSKKGDPDFLDKSASILFRR